MRIFKLVKLTAANGTSLQKILISFLITRKEFFTPKARFFVIQMDS